MFTKYVIIDNLFKVPAGKVLQHPPALKVYHENIPLERSIENATENWLMKIVKANSRKTLR